MLPLSAACSGSVPAGFLDAGTADTSTGLRDVSPTFDAYVAPQPSGASVLDATACLAADPASGSAGDTCLARGFRSPCAFLCGFAGDAGFVYSCATGELPPGAGSCVSVDAGALSVQGTVSLCCASETCVRYSVADPACNTGDTTGKSAWSCPAGVALPGAASTAVGPTPDTIIWCE